MCFASSANRGEEERKGASTRQKFHRCSVTSYFRYLESSCAINQVRKVGAANSHRRHEEVFGREQGTAEHVEPTANWTTFKIHWHIYIHMHINVLKESIANAVVS